MTRLALTTPHYYNKWSKDGLSHGYKYINDTCESVVATCEDFTHSSNNATSMWIQDNLTLMYTIHYMNHDFVHGWIWFFNVLSLLVSMRNWWVIYYGTPYNHMSKSCFSFSNNMSEPYFSFSNNKSKFYFWFSNDIIWCSCILLLNFTV